MEENKEIREAMEELEEISSDYEMRRLAELKEKAIWDENSAKRAGREEGRELGRKEGIKEGIRTIAIKMKKENMPIETIAKITELTEEEIKEL